MFPTPESDEYVAELSKSFVLGRFRGLHVFYRIAHLLVRRSYSGPCDFARPGEEQIKLLGVWIAPLLAGAVPHAIGIITSAPIFFSPRLRPLVLSVHTIVSFDFAVSILPGWHTTIFPPYFVAGAIFSGFAMVLTLLSFVERSLVWKILLPFGISRT